MHLAGEKISSALFYGPARARHARPKTLQSCSVVRLFGVRIFFVAELRSQQWMLPLGRPEATPKALGAVGQVEPLLGQLQKAALVTDA